MEFVALVDIKSAINLQKIIKNNTRLKLYTSPYKWTLIMVWIYDREIDEM